MYVKNKTSETNVSEPGNPRNRRQFMNDRMKSFGQSRFKPLNSVIRRVLNRLLIASTSRKAFEERRA